MTADADGRFVFDDVEHGLTRFVIRSAERAVAPAGGDARRGDLAGPDSAAAVSARYIPFAIARGTDEFQERVSEHATQRRARRREPSLNPPPYILNQHGARVLDPTNAVRAPGQPAVRATVYVGSQLLVRDADVAGGARAADQGGQLRWSLDATFVPLDPQLLAVAERHGLRELADRTLASRVVLTPEQRRAGDAAGCLGGAAELPGRAAGE